MPATENVRRRGAVYWRRRRMRFVAGKNAPITITVTASLQTKDQATARQRAAALTVRSEVIRMSLYDQIERDGLSADQAQLLFQAEVVRYRNMLAHHHTSIQSDGDGDVAARLAQMLAIYEAANSDFATYGFAGYMVIGYVGSFDERFASLDGEARQNLLVMLSRFDNAGCRPIGPVAPLPLGSREDAAAWMLRPVTWTRRETASLRSPRGHAVCLPRTRRYRGVTHTDSIGTPQRARLASCRCRTSLPGARAGCDRARCRARTGRGVARR